MNSLKVCSHCTSILSLTKECLFVVKVAGKGGASGQEAPKPAVASDGEAPGTTGARSTRKTKAKGG